MIWHEMDILLYRKLEHIVVQKVDNERPFTRVFWLCRIAVWMMNNAIF
jgi:hypothetical protein